MSRLAAIVVSVVMLVACAGQSGVATATPKTAIRWSQTAAPPGVDVPGAEWLKIEGAGGTSANVQVAAVQVAAVVRPQGPGPFPLVIWFHGGQGFHVGDVTIAAQLTAAGFMVLVGCWQYTPIGATIYEGVSYQNIPCLQAPASFSDAVSALIEVGRQLPGLKKDAIGLFGISASGPLVLQYAVTKTDVGAVVVDSPAGCVARKVTVPVLILGGTADFMLIDAERSCEQTLRNLGTTVESHFYEGGTHGVTYFDPVHVDARQRTTDFFKRYLG
jgi:dienelactone hydrolase